MDEKKIPQTEEKVIPQVTVSDNKIVLATKEVKLIVNDEETTITMQKLPAGKKRDLVKANAGMKVVGSQVQGSIDSVGYQIGVLSKVIIKAPFPVDQATIESLGEDVIDYLFEEYTSWNPLKKKV